MLHLQENSIEVKSICVWNIVLAECKVFIYQGEFKVKMTGLH